MSEHTRPASIRYRITGKVQGVFFRASTRDQALRLGISGHAKNLADGSVEVLAAGSEEALAALADWLHEGPRLARVESVSAEATDIVPPGGFVTG